MKRSSDNLAFDFDRRLRGKVLGAASTLALALAFPTSAFAQAAPQALDDAAKEDGEESEIVVTGLQYGLATSISTKRDELSIVEAVSAEDIGKLPDVSIAEAISRLPGLTTQRVNGRAQVISIRGMAPDFSTTLLNGRQQASSGCWCVMERSVSPWARWC